MNIYITYIMHIIFSVDSHYSLQVQNEGGKNIGLVPARHVYRKTIWEHIWEKGPIGN